MLDEDKRLVSAVDYYFIQEDGARFKVLGTGLNILYSLQGTGTGHQSKHSIVFKVQGTSLSTSLSSTVLFL